MDADASRGADLRRELESMLRDATHGDAMRLGMTSHGATRSGAEEGGADHGPL